jgi:pimeloyl-ACP methyl ester carboxylesterase
LADNLGVCVVCWDYPEYGLSTGELDEFSCYNSIEDVVSHYKKMTNKILLCGQSLGTGIVVDWISKHVWTNPVVLISPYKSIPKVITGINLVESLICKNKFATYQKIGKTNCPIKIFHGRQDDLIGVSHPIELYELVPNKILQPHYIDNTGHNDILGKIDLNEFVKLLNMIN